MDWHRHAGHDEAQRVEVRLDFLETEAGRIEAWRLLVLLRANYPYPIAEDLARDFEIDLHLACELLDHGCMPELAREILT